LAQQPTLIKVTTSLSINNWVWLRRVRLILALAASQILCMYTYAQAQQVYQ